MQEQFYLVKADEYKVQDGDSIKSLADQAGITWQELVKFNWGTENPYEINKILKTKVGCTKRTADGNNYVFSSKDDPGIIYIPRDYPAQVLPLNQLKKVSISRPKIFSSVYLQTTDFYGHKKGNVSLILKSLEGWPDVNITTNANGVGKKEKVLAGSYRVTVGNKPGYFLSKTNELADNPNDIKLKYGKFIEAVLHTDYRYSAITRIVVLSGSEDQLFQKENDNQQVYPIQEIAWNVEDEGDQIHQETGYCADNLALAAGWKKGAPDIYKLMNETLKSWLSDNYNEVISKDYFVYLILPESSEILFYNSDGKLEGTFLLKSSIKINGGIGVYGTFEIYKEFPFYDMASQNYSLQSDPSSDDQDSIKIIDLILESQLAQFISLINQHTGQTELAFYLGGNLGAIALMGGTGRLENYGDNNAVREHVHKRNLAVLKTIKETYNYYVDKVYIPQLTDVTNEDQLRAIGPPRAYFQMPMPVGIKGSELTDLVDAMNAEELKPWTAVAEKLDEIFKRHTQGDVFLRFKAKYKQPIIDNKSISDRDILKKYKGSVTLEYEIEFNYDIEKTSDGFRVVTKTKQAIKLTIKGDTPATDTSPNGYPIEASIKTSPTDINDRYFLLRVGMFKIEVPIGKNAHKKKVELKDIIPGLSAEASFDAASAEMYTGLNVSTKDLVEKLVKSDEFKKWCENKYGLSVEEARKVYPGFNKWLTILASFEFGVGIGFTGLKEETALAVFGRVHGFFERKSIQLESSEHLCDFKWNELRLWEQSDLTILQWTMDTWDKKYLQNYKDKLPESLKKSRGELKDEEKFAIVDLGFYDYDDYRIIIKKKIELVQQKG